MINSICFQLKESMTIKINGCNSAGRKTFLAGILKDVTRKLLDNLAGCIYKFQTRLIKFTPKEVFDPFYFSEGIYYLGRIL
jgi:hypothetical protein